MTTNAEALWPQLMARLRALPNSEVLAFDFDGVGIAIQRELTARAKRADDAEHVGAALREMSEAWEQVARDAGAELAAVIAERDLLREMLPAALRITLTAELNIAKE